MNLQQLPTEVLHEILLVPCLIQVVDDVDLQSTSRVSHQLRTLVLDKLLWSRIHHFRTPQLLDRRLSSRSRPGRAELVTRNIIRSGPSQTLLQRQLGNGQYINGPWGANSHNAAAVMNRTQRNSALNHRLMARRPLSDLETNHIHIMPIADMQRRYLMAVMRDRLNRMLSSRTGFLQLDQAITKTHISTGGSYQFLHVHFDLMNQLLAGQLVKRLGSRPEVHVLERMKLLPTNSTTALMQCPAIKDRLFFFEQGN